MSDTPRPKIDWIWTNVLFLTGLPVAAAIATPLYVAHYGLAWSEVLVALFMWWFTGLGITAGYHRMLAHRGWSAPAWVRALAVFAGGAAAQNSAIAWVAAHRYHHKEVDTPGDPYNVKQGFWHAHVLWVLQRGAHHDDFDNVPDLWKDPVCRFQHRWYGTTMLAVNVALPVAFGLLTGRVLGMLVIAGLLRIVVVHHFTFFINSLAHMWGTRHWSREVTARDNWLLSLVTLGEGYHNFHHAFQADYRNGVGWYAFDPTKWFIWALSRVGLARDLRRTPVDVLLRTRFEAKRADYRARIEEWEATVRERVLQAERAIEDELTRLRDARQEWSRRSHELKDQARAEMRRALRDAQRAAAAEMRRWEDLVVELARQPGRSASLA